MPTPTHQAARDQQPGPRIALRVRWGQHAHHQAILAPGQVLRVGSGQGTGLAIAHDAQLANEHFELAWDGAECRLRDLKSAGGTLVNGEPVTESVLTHEAWIRAGSTDFSVYFEAAVEAPRLTARQQSALEALSTQENLFAILDAARSERVLKLLRESLAEYRSLYEGPQGDALEEAAPYLVRLPPGEKLLERLVQEGWEQCWGVYFTCALPFLETRRHLRKFLMVEAEGISGRLYFRFYDPRVLPDFLRSCSPEQRDTFFGPITQFFYETDNGLVAVPSTGKPAGQLPGTPGGA